MNTKKLIKKSIAKVCGENYPEAVFNLNDLEVSYPPAGFGDYASNAAMRLAGMTKGNPLDIAGEIKEKLEKLKEVKQVFEKIEVAKPGFLNFYLKKEYLAGLVENIQKQGNKFGCVRPKKSRKIILEFVSANPTGPIHLGNSRGGPFGDVLASVLTKAGHKVFREYYVNDFGNQIKILGHSILKDEEVQYSGDYIEELAKENKEKDPFEAGKKGAGKILEKFIKPSMQNLGIDFDNYFSEEELHKKGKIDEVLQKLKERDLTYEKDGALWFKAAEFGDDKDRVLRKKTGEITYFGGDIAYHQDKFDRGFDLAVNVWGADHHGDVKRMLGAMEAIDHKDQLQILLTQFVKVFQNEKEVKMSKRHGNYISIDDLLTEAGRDAVRFFFLMYSANSQVNFDLDLAKEQSQKNPVYYVQYAYARIAGILEKTREEDFQERFKPELIQEEKELDLLKHLNRFPELVEDIADNYEVHRLPYYAMELADKFHSFYHGCKVLDMKNPELSSTRIELVKSTKTVFKEVLDLLGIEVRERM
ncbi:MAG: arginine--tRNA ligase [Candidatus Moraniibacteriota bacterium]